MFQAYTKVNGGGITWWWSRRVIGGTEYEKGCASYLSYRDTADSIGRAAVPLEGGVTARHTILGAYITARCRCHRSLIPSHSLLSSNMSNSQQDKSKSSGKAKEEPSYVETYASQARLGIPGADHAVKGSYWPLEDYNGPSKWEYPTTYPGRIPKDFKLETSNAYGVLEDMTQNAARSKDPRDTAIDNATSYALNRPAELSPAEQARLKEMADEQALSEATEARQREIGKAQQARLAARGTHEMRASIDRDLKQASSVLAASILKARLKYQQQGSNSSAWAASKDGAATIKNLTEAIDSFQTLESERQLQGDDQTKRTCFKSSYLDHTPLTMLRMIKANSKPIQDRNGGDCFLQLHKADDHSLCAVEMGLWGEAWLDKILYVSRACRVTSVLSSW